ncbi:glycosyltransferase family 2 protein [Anaerocolumna chitinilytica]|uniref:Glycosyltransferase 2-like domain-containing protein n=1 Tax=Anaerocolumna chitinilytica TaxID=1727145 RepID=A0A7I8DX08_9FIRM|nr:glycosyltransferase family 2 protein [Anaerocolumna chitinilytica]BCK00817.1 hypothetical protein bsdcttw_38570 [Anaerocolumna chitinilytica]
MITVLTATYNRGNILHYLYNSLLEQTSKDFEWIVIDDGSEDNTEIIVNKWISETPNFNISYYKMKNGGKHRAVNLGVTYAKYSYIFIVDSDDYLLNNTIGKIHEWIKTISHDNTFAGVSGVKGYDKDSIVGEYPKLKNKNYIDATNLQRNKFHLNGDKAEIYRTDLLKKYPFPEFENEKFVTEATVWNAIAYDGYKIRWFRDIIYICKYNEDGLTQMGIDKEINSYNGFVHFIKQRMKTEKGINYIKAICTFTNVSRKKGYNTLQMSNILGINLLFIKLINIIDSLYRVIKSS